MRHIVGFSIALGTVLLYLLWRASSNTALFAEHYTLLIVLNAVVATLLLGLIGYQIWLVRRRIRAQQFGARLTKRLILVFALMAIVPGTVIYGVSVQFLTRSIESWFDVRVDSALEGGLNLGRSALDAQLAELTRKAEAMALTLADEPASGHITTLNRLREQAGVAEATLFSARGAVIAFSSADPRALTPKLPGPAILRQVRQQQPYRSLEVLGERGLYLRAVVPVNVLSLTEDIRILQLMQPVPRKLAEDAEAVQEVYRDYQELSFSRRSLSRLFTLSLTMTLLLALLSAVAAAFLVSQRLSAPLGLLAEGTRAVGKGDFTPVQPVKARDELGMLINSFNAMTRQLAETRAQVESKQRQLEAAKGYLESILAHLSSGVLAFDESFHLRTVNPTAAQILGVDFAALKGLEAFAWGERKPGLTPFSAALARHFRDGGEKDWQEQIELTAETGSQVLLVRGTRLPAQAEGGYVVVFDDITHLIQAQRAAAWGEVARRLAHEIKNPLTPIQLSAERLEHKLTPKLTPEDAAMLARSTQTIVNQVAALKSMVNDFSEYARAPVLQARPLDLNALVGEVLALYEHAEVPVSTEFGSGLAIEGDAKLLRQVIHNLLRNAQDAVAQTPNGRITVRTEASGAWAQLKVMDNGPGFPPEILARAFEPYVTTKAKGTGLGLAIVKKIVDEHHGRVEIRNLEPLGACVCVHLPLTLAQARDQAA
ncbi:sensor histidine kinase [Thiobacter aerophilum]|uniref:histidine kinase n=1 Tax=Thiobacter aerophilum TaxID=3121275 RepID=A0ABV0EES5_9BURK